MVLGLFDKRAERITRRKEEGSGEHHVPVLHVGGEEEGGREGGKREEEGGGRGREENERRREEGGRKTKEGGVCLTHISLISFLCFLLTVSYGKETGDIPPNPHFCVSLYKVQLKA